MKISVLLFIVLFVVACGQKAADNRPIEQPAAQFAKIQLPDKNGIDRSTLQNVVDKADQLDFMFNDLPVSMNQAEKGAILQNLAAISKVTIESIPPNCKPLARLVYNGNGEIIIEADLYLTKGCQFVVFIKDEKRLFGNELVPEGVEFYNAILSQVKSATPQ